MQDQRQVSEREAISRKITQRSPAPRRAHTASRVPLPRQHCAAYATLLSQAVQQLQDAFGGETGRSAALNHVPVRVSSGLRRRGGPAG